MGNAMRIRKCGIEDSETLAFLNKQLIEDEKSDNQMNVAELAERMKGFLQKEYSAYFFEADDSVLGYALVKTDCKPLYLRQFFIARQYRRQRLGTEAFHALMNFLDADTIDIEVLSRNEAGKRFWENLGFNEISRYMRKSPGR